MITTIVRTVILYVFVTLGIRLMGKRQIGDMQPNELVITLLISEIAAIPLQDTSQPILNGITAIFMLVILEIVMSVLAMKSMCVRKFMSGKSVVIIKDGIVDQKAMQSVRMTVLDLVELLRGQNVFDIMTGVAITILVKNPKVKTEKATIYYHDIGEYLKRSEKLEILQQFKNVNTSKIEWKVLKPSIPILSIQMPLVIKATIPPFLSSILSDDHLNALI